MKLKRIDIKAILADPAQRRMMVARGTVAIQAREGIDITLEQALESYDRLEASGELARVRRLAATFGGTNGTN